MTIRQIVIITKPVTHWRGGNKPQIQHSNILRWKI